MGMEHVDGMSGLRCGASILARAQDAVIEYKYVICDNEGRPSRWEDACVTVTIDDGQHVETSMGNDDAF
eukprot:5453248-Amphidinium_carterae.1